MKDGPSIAIVQKQLSMEHEQIDGGVNLMLTLTLDPICIPTLLYFF